MRYSTRNNGKTSRKNIIPNKYSQSRNLNASDQTLHGVGSLVQWFKLPTEDTIKVQFHVLLSEMLSRLGFQVNDEMEAFTACRLLASAVRQNPPIVGMDILC